MKFDFIMSARLLCLLALTVLPSGAIGVLDQVTKVDRGAQLLSKQLRHPAPQNTAASALLQVTEGQAKRTHLHQRRSLRSHRQKIWKTKQSQETGSCNSNKLRWWIKIKKKCVKSFGRSSRWDKSLQDGKCAEAWNVCNTGFYATCCSQPEGPRTLKVFCAGRNLTTKPSADEDDDKACQVQTKVAAVQDVIKAIKGTIGLMGVADPPAVQYSFAPSPSGAPSPAVATAPAASEPEAPPGILAKSEEAAPAPAPAPLVAHKIAVPAAAPLKSKCDMLKELTTQAQKRIKAVKSWAERDGMQERSQIHKHKNGKPAMLDDAEAKDPDLVFSIKGVIGVGEQLDALLKAGDFCYRQAPAEDDGSDDDHDDDDEEEASDDEEDDTEDEEDGDADEVKINETAILSLLAWDSNMDNAVDKFEEDVHPHGFKWWRYRYEYSIIESIVFAFSVMFMYLTMCAMHCVSFSRTFKFYKTGITSDLLRYAWTYLVFHGAALMAMVFITYMLYAPWGKQNIFNMFAGATHEFVNGRANVPFLGYSWMYMALDVQFQLFVTFGLYALFIIIVVTNYQNALQGWRALCDGGSCSATNAEHYRALDGIMKNRVSNTSAYKQIFLDLNLRLEGVDGLDKVPRDWNDFKLYLYLTDGLGKSLEYLVEVSLTTTLALALMAVIVGLLAHHLQVAFMYFLPGFILLGLLLFVASYFVSHHFRMLAGDPKHNTPANYMTIHSFCRVVQIVMYCLFYSFSRLLLSNDIFESYTKVYISALVGLVIVMVLLATCAGEVMKMICCALILPPHMHQDEFAKSLQQVVFWHTTEKCHECGVQQFAVSLSHSREWAGKAPVGDRQQGQTDDTVRPYSWRP